jgi:hypothetical protein
MAEIIYVLCALTSTSCAILLIRGYLHNKTSLLLWSSLCFVGLAINNILLYIDLAIVPGPEIDLSLWRSASASLSMVLLVYGLVRETT